MVEEEEEVESLDLALLTAFPAVEDLGREDKLGLAFLAMVGWDFCFLETWLVSLWSCREGGVWG